MSGLRRHLNRLLERSPWGRKVIESATPEAPQPIMGQMMSRWNSEHTNPIGLCHIATPVEGGWELARQYYHTVTVSAVPGVIGACKQVWVEGGRQFISNQETAAQAVEAIRASEQALLEAPAQAPHCKWQYDRLAEGPVSNLFSVSRRLGMVLPNPAGPPQL